MANRNWSRSTLLARLLEAVTTNTELAFDVAAKDILDDPTCVSDVSLTRVVEALKTDIVRESMGERLG